jgi:HK97 family phage portal protein
MTFSENIARARSWLARAVEGQYRPGPYQLPVTGGWLSADAGQYLNWWQMGYSPMGLPGGPAMVEACVSAYSQTISMCPGDHWRLKHNGGRERVANSAASRILRHPNAYQSMSDFMLNTVRSLYLEGNAYALALRNDRFEVTELHLMNPWQSRPHVSVDGDIFYSLAGNNVVDRYFEVIPMVPARDVLHIRLHCMDRRWPFPLVGETPLVAAYGDVTTSQSIQNQQNTFYANQARPSAVLSTDLVLDRAQTQELRDRWEDQVRGMHSGGTPILTAGLKVQPWAQSGRDTQIAEVMRLSDEHIALAFRIPLPILGLGRVPHASTEVLMQSWVASGLGFALNHVEEAFGMLFVLKGQPDEYVEFDTSSLLRSAMKERIEALSHGVIGGIYAPNEARRMEGLPDVKFGDEPRVQQQVVPLSFAGKVPPAPASPPSPSTPAVPAPAPPVSTSPKDHIDVRRHIASTLLSSADRFDASAL